MALLQYSNQTFLSNSSHSSGPAPSSNNTACADTSNSTQQPNVGQGQVQGHGEHAVQSLWSAPSTFLGPPWLPPIQFTSDTEIIVKISAVPRLAALLSSCIKSIFCKELSMKSITPGKEQTFLSVLTQLSCGVQIHSPHSQSSYSPPHLQSPKITSLWEKLSSSVSNHQQLTNFSSPSGPSCSWSTPTSLGPAFHSCQQPLSLAGRGAVLR